MPRRPGRSPARDERAPHDQPRGRGDLPAGGRRLRRLAVHPAVLTPERIEVLRTADDLVTRIVRARGLYDAIWQMPGHAAAGQRAGRETIVLRPVNSRDGMTADFARLPAPVVAELARALGDLPRVDAVLYDVTNKPRHHRARVTARRAARGIVHLHVHSSTSLLDGAAQLEKLVKKARTSSSRPRAHRPRQPLRRIDFYLAPEGGDQADPGRRAVRGAGQAHGARLAGRRL